MLCVVFVVCMCACVYNADRAAATALGMGGRGVRGVAGKVYKSLISRSGREYDARLR